MLQQKIVCLARDAKDELETLRNISKEEVKTSVCSKLQCITELVLRLEEFRSRHILEVERQKAGRAHALENAIEKMDVPGKMKGLRKTLEERPKTVEATTPVPCAKHAKTVIPLGGQAQDRSSTSLGALRGKHWRIETIFRMQGHQRMAPRIGPVKAAIIILDSGVDVEEDQRLIDENVTASVITAGNCRIGVVSMYLEGAKSIGPYLDRVKWACSKFGINKSHPGGAVDVTACSSALLDRAEEWQVVWGVTSSDHNAVTFKIRIGGRPRPEPFRGTRIYNTAKARWSEFLTAFDNAKEEQALTTEMVETVGSCDQLDGVVGLYTECIRHSCDAAIPRKHSMRKVKLRWWSSEPEGLKNDANTKNPKYGLK
ncbi:hypothetical protein EVAR_96254_1 [Eumeta japonica]|uniref:Uncharacterized protein n=1 Tax=Eumeta variegata TaxID=151549 RepID=A0A4C1WL17_EUMVA|nr:hypothetical protein EVAR_96254_1 [Eumeta japonica]